MYELTKINAPYSTIIDLSGITSSSGKIRNIIYTTSIVVNSNYLNNAFNKVASIKTYTGALFTTEKVIIFRVIRNRHSDAKGFNIESDIHIYKLMQYKEFFNVDMLNHLV